MHNITLFNPYVPESAKKALNKTLNSRWVGQGAKVDEFEKLWEKKISFPHKAVAVGSGTDALHLAYILAGIGEGDEVIAPVFTYPGANIPLLYQRAKIIFADVKEDCLNIDPKDIEKKLTPRTKAIVVVHYGGVPCDMDAIKRSAGKHQLPLIVDAAHSAGESYEDKKIGSISDFTCFSFQAVKMITTGSGGMLTIKKPDLVEKAKRLRLFGMSKTSKLNDRRINDITELGYRYETTDISATMGIESLKVLNTTLGHYKMLSETYRKGLEGIPGLKYIGGLSLCIILTDKRKELEQRLMGHGIESSQVDYRNDIYSIFGGRVKDCPNMDALEDKYLVLPMHYYLKKSDIQYICQIIKSTIA